VSMTLAVYRVDRKTGDRMEVLPKCTVLPLKEPEFTALRYPPCSCPRCRKPSVTK
jgi:hypothetical protein